MRSVSRRILMAFVGLALAAGSARGQQQPARGEFAFPESPQQWINSAPLTVEQLKGKAVFLWFFEEESDSAREYWTTLLALAQRYAKDPILFVGVNSGTPRADVEQYVRECRISWPVIVDPTREFEEHAGLKQITLRNIYQVKVLLPDSTFAWGTWSDVEGTIDESIKNAKWKIGPKEIPPLLKQAWHDVEFGNHAAAAPGLKKSLTSPKPEVKAAAEKLQEVVQKDLDEQLAAATEALDAEQRWKAFNLYTRIAERFKGHDVPESVEKTRKTLAGDPAIKDEIAALKQYDAAVRQLASGAVAQRKRAVTALEKLVKDKPDTEAGRKAQAALDKVEKAGG